MKITFECEICKEWRIVAVSNNESDIYRQVFNCLIALADHNREEHKED